ncbi:hypothetical protein ILUMI_07470 [Ignelater luminosus]|uniref:Uncharacterized protein n=1 Tax=Ignelater luminosus TaxID=2038154 RepID=A0A8K0D7F0_IGNLU|nr:hypothetical protein ILUMI_07470 [Ignelater luminosus]
MNSEESSIDDNISFTSSRPKRVEKDASQSKKKTRERIKEEHYWKRKKQKKKINSGPAFVLEGKGLLLQNLTFDLEKRKKPILKEQILMQISVLLYLTYKLYCQCPVVKYLCTFYYKCRLNCLNFTIFETLPTKSDFCYFLHEGIAHRSVSDTASCILHYLQNNCIDRRTALTDDVDSDDLLTAWSVEKSNDQITNFSKMLPHQGLTTLSGDKKSPEKPEFTHVLRLWNVNSSKLPPH